MRLSEDLKNIELDKIDVEDLSRFIDKAISLEHVIHLSWHVINKAGYTGYYPELKEFMEEYETNT